VFDGVCMVQKGRFEEFLKVVVQMSCRTFEIMLDGRNILVRAIRFLIVIVTAGCNSDPLRASLVPFLPPLMPFLVPLLVALDGAARLPLRTIFPSPRTKTAPTASSLEACQVAISSSSLVVFG
jgi:hypothetical protein